MQALEGAGDGRAKTEEAAASKAEAASAAAAARAGTASAEDRFHLRASKVRGGYDPVTGLVSREEEPVLEDEELPEDRFHRDDALSAHYIHQRDGDREDKWKKHEKEKAERLERKAKGEATGVDDSVQYIDVDDFKPGGKYGPPAVDVAAKRDQLTGVAFNPSGDMLRASKVILDAGRAGKRLLGVDGVGGQAADIPFPVVVGEKGRTTAAVSPSRLSELQSTVWADLLD
jgi:hypothetical protein